MLKLPVSQTQLQDYRCPCCNNESSTQIKHVKLEYMKEILNVEGIPELKQTQEILNVEGNPHDIPLNVCDYCGYIYRAKWLSKETFQDYFRHDHKSHPNYNYYQMIEQKRSQIRGHLKEAEGKRILDIGCGTGLKLDNYIGIELAEGHYKYAKYGNKLDVRNTLYIEDGSFDLIVLFNMLNYIPDPQGYLTELRKKLTFDGKIVISAPVLEMPSVEHFNHALTCEYFSFFTKESLLNLLETTGFEVISYIHRHKNPLIVLKRGKKKELKRDYQYNRDKLESFIKTTHLFRRAIFLQKQQRDNEALQAWETLIKINPYCLEAYINKANSQADNLPFVDEMVNETLKKFPDYVPAIATAARFLYQKQDFVNAIKMNEKCLQFIQSHDIYEVLGHCYYDMRIFDKAGECYRKAYELNPIGMQQLIEKEQACYFQMRER